MISSGEVFDEGDYFLTDQQILEISKKFAQKSRPIIACKLT